MVNIMLKLETRMGINKKLLNAENCNVDEFVFKLNLRVSKGGLDGFCISKLLTGTFPGMENA